jgi:hypothetical protein
MSGQSATFDPIRATAGEVPAIKRLAGQIANREARPKLIGPNNEQIDLPEPVYKLFKHVVDLLAGGKVVTIVQSDRLLTTQDAADILAVSRPFLVKLLDERKGDPVPERRIEFQWVGNRRRIRFEELMRFKQVWDAERMAAADDLVALSQDLGLYD